MRRAAQLGVLCAMWCLAANTPHWAWACQVPVFRYALERWDPTAWKVIIYHRGPLSAKQKELVDQLNVQPDGSQHSANVEAATIDLSQTPPAEAEEIYRRSAPKGLPWLVLIGPEPEPTVDVLWAGPLDEANVRRLVESPLRRQLAARLLGGDSAVWVLLESGDTAKDAAAEATLTKELKALEKQLTIPDPQSDAPPADAGQESFEAAQPSPGVPLRVGFSVLRVSRKAAEEQVFVRTLLAHESRLEKETGPIAFPVFGRGRVLAALCGSEIAHEAISGASEFLVSNCSCMVKGERPGTDLLISADWAGRLDGRLAVDKALPPLTGVLPVDARQTAADVTTAENVPSVPVPDDAAGLWRNVAFAIGAIVAVAIAVTVLVWRREREEL